MTETQKQATQKDQNLIEQATRTIEARGGEVTRVTIHDLNSSGYPVKYRSRTTYRDITLYGTSERSETETIQAKIFPDTLQPKSMVEIYTQQA